jgi:phosphoribosylaminoimidazole-succinocarboxamide synthase
MIIFSLMIIVSPGGARMTETPLYEGKAKKVFRTDRADEYLVFFKDDATAFNGVKKGRIESKGELNNAISSAFFEILAQAGIKTHFLRRVDANSMLVKKVDIIPLEVVTRNLAAGSLAQRLGWAEGKALPSPIVEFYYKDDALGDPLINNSHIAALGLVTPRELEWLELQALAINQILRQFLLARDVKLVDFKLEFGRVGNEIILADEISPDTCRFWDAQTNQKLDKDRFRQDLGQVSEAYQELYQRLLNPAAYKARVEVRLKPSVLDPQGEAILRSLKSLGHVEFSSIRVGKLIELTLTGDSEAQVKEKMAKLADELLANPNMENYAITVEPKQ